MSYLKKTLAAAALMAAFSGAAHAVIIDPDGAPGGAPLLNVDVLDWTVGNAIITPVSGNVQDPQVGDILQTYAHARLATFNNSAGDPVGGLFGSEWTYVTGFQELVTDVSGTPGTGSATFQTIAGGNNFFEIWYSNPNDSSNLTGLDFNNGTLVLSATVSPFDPTDPALTGQTSFTANTPVNPDGSLALSPLDQFNTDDYAPTLTISGQGGGRIGLDIISINTDFIKGGIDSLVMDFDTQLNLPFDKTDPSACFWDGSAYIGGAGGQGTACFSSIGPVNGLNVLDLPDLSNMLMTDSAVTLNGVPEPMSLALMGLGLAAMGGIGARRRIKA